MPRPKPTNKRQITLDGKEIGLRLRAMRIDQDISQEDLANRLGVSFQQVQKYEKGTNRVSADRLMQIANALHTTPHDLMGWNGTGKLTGKDGAFGFDTEAYKLARTFSQLPDAVKPVMRSLIMTIINNSQEE
jgi:transcriptional regulator with XRE-family HTH domain